MWTVQRGLRRADELQRRIHLDVNAIETGKYDPSLELAFKIARLFKARVEDVFKP